MSKTFNVCYLREYMDPEHQGDFFYPMKLYTEMYLKSIDQNLTIKK